MGVECRVTCPRRLQQVQDQFLLLAVQRDDSERFLPRLQPFQTLLTLINNCFGFTGIRLASRTNRASSS